MQSLKDEGCKNQEALQVLDRFEKCINQVNDILNSLIAEPDDFARVGQVPSLVSKAEVLIQKQLSSLEEYLVNRNPIKISLSYFYQQVFSWVKSKWHND